MVEHKDVELRQEGAKLLEKLESRMEKARREFESMTRYQRLNPARRQRLDRYERQLGEARDLWHSERWRDAVLLLKNLDESCPSVIGLIHGMSRSQKHREEVYDARSDANPEVPYPGGRETAGSQAGFGGV